jgi:hypothetical protein
MFKVRHFSMGHNDFTIIRPIITERQLAQKSQAAPQEFMAFWRILLPTKCQKLILINIASCPRRLDSSSMNFFKKHALSVLNRGIFLYSLTQTLVAPVLAAQNSITVICRQPQSGTHTVMFHYMKIFHLKSTKICLCSF